MNADFDKLLKPLTRDPQKTIRDVFSMAGCPQSKADALLADWFRLAEVAHRHALRSNVPPTMRAILLSPSVRRRRDRQLRQATEAATTAIDTINELVELVGKHSDGIYCGQVFSEHGLQFFTDFQRQAGSVTVWLQSTKQAAERYRLESRKWPAHAQRLGTPRWRAETCLLEVLAAYFRKQGWPVLLSETGLFAEVAIATLGRGDSMNRVRLRNIAKSCLDYDALDAVAPREVQFAKPPTTRKKSHART